MIEEIAGKPFNNGSALEEIKIFIEKGLENAFYRTVFKDSNLAHVSLQ